MAQPGYRDIIAAIKKGNPASVYLLMGEEDYYIDLIVNALETSVVADEDKDFNQNVYYGVDADMDTIVASCQQLSIIGGRRLVLLKEAQSIPRGKQQIEKLASYVKRPNPSCVFALAFKGDNLNATSEIMKAGAKSGAVIFKADKVRDYQLPTHVKDYCASRKTGIDDKTVALLCDYIGGPLAKLFGEINKLITIKGEGNRLTEEDIEEHIGISKDFNNFELVSAIARKNYTKAVGIIKYFESNPKNNPTVLTTAVLFGFFTNLVSAFYLPDRSDSTLRQEFGLRNLTAFADFKEALRNYNAFQAVNIIHLLRDFDVKSKGVGSFQNEYSLLFELVFKIFTI